MITFVLRHRTTAKFAALASLASIAFGQTTLYWDQNGATAGLGGSGAWTTQSSGPTPNKFWTTNSAGAANGGQTQAWANNTPPDTAVFSGTAGTVTVGTTGDTSVTATNITFGVSGYTISAGTLSTLTLAATSVIDTGAFNATISVGLGGAGTLLTKNGSGTLTLSGSNSYTGATTVSAGTLSLGANSTLPSTTAVTVSSGATLDVNQKTQTVASIAGAGTISFGGSGTLTLNQASGTSFSGAISGSGATLAKSGAGTLTLSGSSAATIGTVSISAGALNFQRSSAATAGAINFTGGQVNLGTTGVTSSQFGTSTNVSFNGGGTLALGISSTQSFGTLSILGSGGTIDFTSGSTGTISFTGAGTFTSGQSLAVNGYNYNSGSGTRLQVPGLNQSQLDQILFGGIGAAYAAGGGNYLVPSNDVSAIPEPSTYAALAGIGVLGLAVYRRRQARETSKLAVTASV